MRIEIVDYDHPDSQQLIEVLQQEYVDRYGEEDVTAVDPAEFRPPQGLFLLGYSDGRPVGSGGWRAREGDEPGLQDGDAEMKRLFIVAEARGSGLSRQLLAELEHTAAKAGRKRMVLETGERQPEAIGLYTSAGYAEIEKFGAYRDDPLSRCYAKEL
ncbi:GNAT family N-acetyltransferase [Saccharopolyspora oryzae]|uniref:GNAT family N-acetyltransferase n=1 Tax=Saccharopolyspora oryzae TaxID=2997343 RepID=A0ABT4V231_9PSEU|nr:GNAT family N-acetyltransferase [Saccharopolyspora oryzae]MDA3628017.1 GNAT family N-acetyltransferase [Saccharopolyspora oryzae]